jgi:hypothetical protein
MVMVVKLGLSLYTGCFGRVVRGYVLEGSDAGDREVPYALKVSNKFRIAHSVSSVHSHDRAAENAIALLKMGL